jgi:hypothetical protein
MRHSGEKNNMAMKYDSLPEHLRRRIDELDANIAGKRAQLPVAPLLPEKPCQQSGRRKTKAETAFVAILAAWRHRGLIRQWLDQAVTLRFEDGTRYTPDYTAITHQGELWHIEIKGGYRGPGWEQGYERFRRARDVFSCPGARLVMATKSKTGWKIEGVDTEISPKIAEY